MEAIRVDVYLVNDPGGAGTSELILANVASDGPEVAAIAKILTMFGEDLVEAGNEGRCVCFCRAGTNEYVGQLVPGVDGVV